MPAGAIEDSRFKYLLGTRTYTQSSQGSIQAPLRSEPPRRGGGIVESAPLFSFRAQRRRRRHAGGPEKVDGQLDAIPATRPPWPPRHEGCAARAVIQQLDATAATKNELQRISTIYVGGKQDTSDFAILRRVYMCDVDGCAVPRGRFGSRCGQRRSRARGLAQEPRHRRHR